MIAIVIVIVIIGVVQSINRSPVLIILIPPSQAPNQAT